MPGRVRGCGLEPRAIDVAGTTHVGEHVGHLLPLTGFATLFGPQTVQTKTETNESMTTMTMLRILVPLALLFVLAPPSSGQSPEPSVGSSDMRDLDLNSTADGDVRLNGVAVVSVHHHQSSHDLHDDLNLDVQ